MRSDPLEGVVRTRGETHLDGVTWPDWSTVHDDAHDAGLADDFAVLVAPDDGPEQARLKGVKLRTKVTQTGDLDNGLLSKVQECAAREPEHVNAGGENVR